MWKVTHHAADHRFRDKYTRITWVGPTVPYIEEVQIYVWSQSFKDKNELGMWIDGQVIGHFFIRFAEENALGMLFEEISE